LGPTEPAFGKYGTAAATTAAAGEAASFGLSASRLDVFRETVGPTLGSYDIEALSDTFSCSVNFWRLPGLGISRIDSTPVRISRSRELAAKGARDLTLVVTRGGALTLAQRDREVDLGPADACLYSNEYPLRMARTASRQFYLSLARADLSPMLASPDAAFMTQIPGSADAVRLLSGYLELVTAGGMATAELRRLAADHVLDLVAAALGASRDAAEIAQGRGIRAARLRALQADIAEHLADGDVSAASLAARHRVSPRYIHKLFEGEGTTLSRFVLAQRLARAHRLLTDRRHAHRTIGALAFAAGFGDLSTFNHAFRRRYGATPSEVRLAARMSDGVAP
jgi:AraC-like DNA-binding protein